MTMTGTPRPDLWIWSTRLRPLTRPWRSASTITTSGRSSWIWPIALPPSVSTSSSFTLACAFSRPRMYWATCGTSSTMSRRVWSLDAIRPTIPRGSVSRKSLGGPGPASDRRRAVAVRASPRSRTARSLPGPERAQVVAAGEQLDDQPGVLGEGCEARRPRPAAAGRGGPSARTATALLGRLEDRRQRDRPGRRVVLGRPGPSSPVSPVSGSGRGHSRIDPAVEPGEVLGIGQPDVDRGDAARAPGDPRGSGAPRAARPGSSRTMQRVQGEEREADTGRHRAGADPTRSASTSVRRSTVSAPAVGRATARAREHRRVDVDAGDPVAGGGERHGQASGTRPRARGSGRRSAPRAPGRGRGHRDRRRGRGRRAGRGRRPSPGRVRRASGGVSPGGRGARRARPGTGRDRRSALPADRRRPAGGRRAR